MQLGEVLPLQQHAGEPLAERIDERVDEFVVLGAADALVPPTEIERIRQQRFVVGADVEHHRQRSGRIEPTGSRVQRELADRNPHASDAEVAEAEHPFTIGDHHDVDVEIADGVVEQFLHAIALRPRQEQPPLAAVDPRPLLTSQADGRCVHDRQQLGEMPFDERVEQHGIAVLQCAQEDMATQVRLLGRVLVFDALELRVEVLHHWWEQAVETEPLPLLRGERGALVQIPIHQDCPATRCHRDAP